MKLPQPFDRWAQHPMAAPGLFTGVAVVAVSVALCLGRATVGQLAQLNQTKQSMAEAQALLLHASEEARTRAQVEDASAAVEERLRAGGSTARVLELLGDAAHTRQLTLRAVQADAQQRAAEHATLGPTLVLARAPLTLTITGGYRMFAEFLDALQAMPCLVSVQELLVRKADDATRVTGQLTLGVYTRP